MSEYTFVKDYQPNEQQVLTALAAAGFPTPTKIYISGSKIELEFAADLSGAQLTTLKNLANKIGYFYTREV